MAIPAGGREYYADAVLVAEFTSSGTFTIPNKKFKAFLCKQETSGVSAVSIRAPGGSVAVISTTVISAGNAEIIPISPGGTDDIFVDGSTLVTGGTCKIYMLF